MFTYGNIFGHEAGWLPSGTVLTESGLVIPSSALSYSYQGLAAYPDPTAQSATATLSRILLIASRVATDDAIKQSLDNNLAVRVPEFGSPIVQPREVNGEVYGIWRTDIIQASFLKEATSEIASTDY